MKTDINGMKTDINGMKINMASTQDIDKIMDKLDKLIK